jgi:release factor glutamine methyltransferase
MNYEIYEPEDDSYLLQGFVQKYSKGTVLDMGTGSGIQAISALDSKNVKKVYALDINQDAINYVKDQIKNQKIKNIIVEKSDLFSAIKNKRIKFDTIIFNPPYLPFDKRETGNIAVANSGGKHGYELAVRFLNEASNYLKENGKILLVISTLTKPEKINESIRKNLFETNFLAEKSFFMEKLFVLLIEKSKILKKLEKRKVKEIAYLAEGKRGFIFTGKWKNKKIAIKIKKLESKAENTILKEVKWQKALAGKKIAPKLYFYEKDFIAREFIDGDFILDYFEKSSRDKIKRIIIKIIEQLILLDKLKVSKEEMHHPIKHIIVRRDIPYLIDFERMHKTEKPKNVTQFFVFLSSNMVSEILQKKKLCMKRETMIELGRKYKNGELTCFFDFFDRE